MKIHFKKILVSFFVILGFIFYAFYQRNIIAQENLVNTLQTGSTAAQSTTEDLSTATDIQNSSAPPEVDDEEDYEIGDNEEDEDEDEEEDEEEEDDEDYVASQSTQSNPDNTTATVPPASDTTASGTTSSDAATSSANNVSGLYRDGQYDGNSVDAYYGNVQVRAIVQGGKLVDVQFLSYPNDRNYSIEINKYAMPILKSEAIKAQSAQVDIVTGATNTSRAFIKSLSSALSQAQV